MQQIVLGEALSGLRDVATAFQDRRQVCFGSIWDVKHARFEHCFIPVLTAIPLVVSVIVLLFNVLSATVPRKPQWARPFVVEIVELAAEDYHTTERKWTIFTYSLACLSAAGFALETVVAIREWPGFPALFSTMTWLIGGSLVLAKQTRVLPLDVLTIFAVQALAQAIVVADSSQSFRSLEGAISIVTLVFALLRVIVMLWMPLRDPDLPSKEISQPPSEPTSSLRSPEDNLTLWQFMTVSWMTPLIRVGSKRQLQDEDVWHLPYEFQHQRLHDNFRQLRGTVIQRLVRANGIDLVILTFLGLLELVANYSTPVLLQRLLSAMEDTSAPMTAAVIYAAISLAVRLVACQSGVFSLWYGRRCYERSRGEMITMLYEKTLGRKIAFAQEEKSEATDKPGSGNGHAPERDIPGKRKPTAWSRITQRLLAVWKQNPPLKVAKEPASMGKILNLMRNDVYEVAQRFWEFQNLITKPLSCVFSITLVVRLFGWPSMLAVLALVLAQSTNAVLARIMVHYEKKRRSATDTKLQLITQFVEAIRHLRWYGWQGHWLDQILTARQRELYLRVVTSYWNLLIGLINSLALDLTPVIAFFAYTVIAGQPLRVDIAFPAMQLFQMMSSALRDLPNLIIVIINAWVAVGRIEDFMAEPDRQEMNTEALIGDDMAIEHGDFSWPGVDKPVLRDINLSFPQGMTVVCGEVASGKTALLQALLGELDMTEGQLLRPREPIGYCAQAPWLQSMSVRDNILFSAPHDELRYKSVLDACALMPDLAEFKAGDLSLIGENGIGLSGGQKARVALARAVYSRTKILLLDDPLSALDQQTAESIVQKCFASALLEDRTVVLVTHRTDLVLGTAKQIIKLEHGEASVLDHDAAAHDSLQRMTSTESKDEAEQPTSDKKVAAAVPAKFIEDEHRAHGGVKAKVYWEYIRAGDLRWWALLVVFLVLYRLVSVAETWYLKAWGEAYNSQSEVFSVAYSEDAVITTARFPSFNDLPPPDVNIKPWLIGFFILALGQSLSFIITQAIMIVIVYVAARRMFRDIMDKVANASFRFYDVTPVGRLMNRMTSDIGVLDGNISQQFQSVAWLTISWVSSLVVIGSVTPVFLAFSALLTAAFVLIFLRFLPTSQSLRRLEMVSLTPLMSNFGALLNGLATVRAFNAQSRFQDRVVSVVDTFQKMDHFYWSLQAWLMYRYDALSAISTFLITMLALTTDVSPGLTAFVLVAANKFVSSTHYLCKQYGQLQMEFVSVERVVELLHIDQEARGAVTPPAWWPSSSGNIVFRNVTIRYAPHLDPALSGVSFTIQGGSKTAIIGRTGSGKSTLALAMLATILPSDGSIMVDNIDLAAIDKQLLRTRITFLAQDPVLFPGTMRQNLDPVSEHSDAACETVLRRVCERQDWDLCTKIEAGGRNLSQGQRQLVGLARAVLRRSAIIILDEATASIDRDTAMQIQQVMHEEMRDSTVITIAHRLEAVRNADYCIVLGKGRIVEQGPAEEMLKDHRSDMVEDE